MGCGQCHLTATGQTRMPAASPTDFASQIKEVLKEAPLSRVSRVNINFMARGEPLANAYIVSRWRAVAASIRAQLPADLAPTCRYNISTILPSALFRHHPNHRPLPAIFLQQTNGQNETNGEKVLVPRLYYSAWSLSEAFKRRWMPGAIPTASALAHLAHYQRHVLQQMGESEAKASVIVHGAFVAGENDDIEKDVLPLLRAVRLSGLYSRFNVVRYNPTPKGPFAHHKESPHIHKIAEIIARENPAGAKLIPRVGLDVHASCGTFASPYILPQ